MAKQAFIYPAHGLSIVDPERRDFLPAEGRVVDLDNFYWLTHLRDGSIVQQVEELPAFQHLEGSSQE